jgi:para-nitrobenzyl esterase
VPILGGTTRDEGMFFYAAALYFNTATVSRTSNSVPRTPEDYAAATKAGAFCIWCNAERKMPPGVADSYPLSDFNGDAMYALARIAADPIRCRELHVLNRIVDAGVPVYAYRFDYDQAPFYAPRFTGYKPRAAHTIDLQFVFDGFHGGHLGVNLDQDTGMPRELNAAEGRLSDMMVGQWTNFARSANPNGTGCALAALGERCRRRPLLHPGPGALDQAGARVAHRKPVRLLRRAVEVLIGPQRSNHHDPRTSNLSRGAGQDAGSA